MSDPTLRKSLIRLAHDRPDLRPALLPLLKEAQSDAAFWREWFVALDRMLPRYNTEKVTDWNKVKNHFRASGLRERDAGAVAHSYQEYRLGNLTLAQAAQDLARELPHAQRFLGRPE